MNEIGNNYETLHPTVSNSIVKGKIDTGIDNKEIRQVPETMIKKKESSVQKTDEKHEQKIIMNPTVVYTDGISESFETLRMISKGAIIGRVINDTFVDYGFIPKSSIKKIKHNGGGETCR